MAEIIDTGREPDRAIERACAVLAEGEPVAIPTETVYGLAADATNPDAISRIYEMKGRPRFNPLISHVSDMAMAEAHVRFDPISRRLAETFWPGPLTLILPQRPDSSVHALASAGLDTLGIRMPDGFSRRVIARFGRPLAAPSANTSGKISPTSAVHVDADLGEKLKLILDAGPAEIGLESTIIKVDGDEIRLLRPGGLDAAEIERLLDRPVIRPETAGATIEAPGMLASHYAPGAAVRLDVADVRAGEALIRYGGGRIAGEEQAAIVLDLSPTGNLHEAAANLFDYMKRADASGAATIAFGPIPSEGLGEAIIDRLQRAAAPRG
ncbi:MULTISPECIES: L-threonylcarbamoyladenylate synthase [Sinorhizobium/Ensifer group]|uniref:L-threonylcarbamoyladenylate synthase n=1 Tax=Sinorhizobium/Ensifer group TaxID=227292 RepID=UPI00070A1746|nr:MULTISPECIES: L-threonylcarbamoyladenylate synthase [Sinorhizobium/Ensifer group]KRD64295.1 translation factor Sua5 [Ensifer sp. Root278]KSV95832.1 translation factor Sua5 [Sinorhizobium sp. GL28]MBD9505941.1 threonylcarbamoyl-AMP synthase [Ensifer sp. ENS10]MBV7516222.1 threonylcarbamoyl-AMP synthase [Ensifer sp. ENS12]SDA42708.1 L-threonylcarbamoyladenylate synthase [Sinorhizobium sp. NFACC03]